MAKREKSSLYAFLKMELCTKESGSSMRTRKMVAEFKFGQMDLDTMVSGEMEWLMATAD